MNSFTETYFIRKFLIRTAWKQMCQFNRHKAMSAISTWNKKINLLRANTNESGMTQRIIMRTGLPT